CTEGLAGLGQILAWTRDCPARSGAGGAIASGLGRNRQRGGRSGRPPADGGGGADHRRVVVLRRVRAVESVLWRRRALGGLPLQPGRFADHAGVFGGWGGRGAEGMGAAGVDRRGARYVLGSENVV